MPKPFRPKKKWAPREHRLVAEYVATHYPNARVFFRPRIGSPPPELAARLGPELAHRMLKSWYKYPDAIVITKDKLIIVEGKIHRPETAIGQLLEYAELVRKSPEFAQFSDKELELQLVTPWKRDSLKVVCDKFGVKYVVFAPDWIKDYLELYAHYWSREYRLAKMLREERESGAAWP